mgnify:CR=1 FL=1
MNKVKIMVIDDHPLVRNGFHQLIETEPDLVVCCEAASVSEAMEKFAQCTPDLVIVDLSLPDGNGLDLIKRLRAKNTDILILVSSMYSENLYAERCLRAGAKGYINKQEASEQVIFAIRQVLKGEIYISNEMTDTLLQRPPNNYLDSALSSVEHLSDRELEVFELIGRGVATSEIAEKLHLSIKTIESHRANMKLKLGLTSGSELMISAVHWVLASMK